MNLKEREKKIEIIAESLDNAIRNSYCDNNSLSGWHVEFWIDKEYLEWSTSGELSQNSWTETTDEDWIHACNIDFENQADCFPDMKNPTKEDYKDAIEETIANLDSISFVEAVLKWGGNRDSEQPRLDEYWV